MAVAYNNYTLEIFGYSTRSFEHLNIGGVFPNGKSSLLAAPFQQSPGRF
jgi:hypothetical protein